MKLTNTMLLFLSCIFTVAAQNFKPAKITKEDLLQKVHPVDTSASAAMLHKLGKTYFAISGDHWELVTEVNIRIKIYKKEGYEYANQQVSYYTGGKTIRVDFSDAYTYNLKNGEVVKTKLKSDGEFREKINEEYERRKITLPDVKEGSIIEYTYSIRSPYFSVFRDWYFQDEIPIDYVEYTVAVPQYFVYNRYLAGYLKIEKTETKYNTPMGRSYQEYIDTFWAKNVKAIKDEAFVSNVENYMSILKHELSSTNFSTGIQKYSTDWASVAKTIYDNEHFGKELNRDSYYKEDLTKLLSGITTPDEKMNTIFGYVKNRMHWDGDNDYYCDKGVKAAYESKSGNAAEINLMLTAMLRDAGLKADPVLVSTRTNGIALFPTYSAYNYVVAGVETDKGTVLLDATSKYTVPDILPVRALNWQGRMIRKDGATKEIELRPKKNSREVIGMSVVMDKDGSVKGKMRDQMFDYYAYTFREDYAEMNEDTYIEKLEKRYAGLELGEYKRTGAKEMDKPVLEEYDFMHKEVADLIGDKIYFSPMLFLHRKENPFKQEVREYPVDFNFTWQDKYMINITMPEGYVIESLPKGVNVVMEENIGSFKYNVIAQNNIIQVMIVFDMNYVNISKDYYKTLKDFYQNIIEKQNEKVVLKKA
ncbi:DUF3857 domain-containing protein [Flavobacterium sp. AG291]|uniref:DUF3857 domain-containing protein n=1 Tax=Flavobacterium sp. AG291 TaxID=2184000 RepID=UPI000E0B8252|nr:DUF3857 domain-containing protein [Flavobacterium sp. AG291]RDI15930.1 uncharacterized protein DUF3857 [Flavobacterium sp. AG291]